MQGKKTIRMTVRFTPQEAKQILERAEEYQMTPSAYIRWMMNQKPRQYPEIQNQLNTLINEVNRIGVNINQIARNQNTAAFRSDDKKRLLAYMQRLNQSVRKVVVDIGNQ